MKEWSLAGRYRMTLALSVTLTLSVTLAMVITGCGGVDRKDSEPTASATAGTSTAATPTAATPTAAVPTEPGTRPHILLLSIDTLRADHLGCYGYDRPTSPHLDRLAAGGLRYQRALAPTPWTLPSHGAMLTGVDPYLLGLTAQWRHVPPEAPSLASTLHQAGYDTAAFVDSTPRGFVGGRRGFDRGFDMYQHAPHSDVSVPRYDMAATVDAALDWLDDRAQPATEAAGQMSPFFLFLHTRSVHAIPTDEPCRDDRCSPYFSPPHFAGRFLPATLPLAVWDNGEGRRGQDYLWWLNEQITEGVASEDLLPAERLAELVALYDGAIAYTDHHFGRLMDALEDRGLAENTLVVVTSDHGEAFLEHRLLMHQEVYEPSLRIPLLMHLPKVSEHLEGEVIRTPVTLEDVAPTLLQQAGLVLADELTGHPLPLQEPSARQAPRQLFSYYLFPEKFDYRAFAVEQGRHKLVAHNPQSPELVYELMEVDTETGERRYDSPEGPPEIFDQMRRELRRQLQRAPIAIAEDPAHPSSPSAEGAAGEALRTLGYID